MNSLPELVEGRFGAIAMTASLGFAAYAGSSAWAKESWKYRLFKLASFAQLLFVVVLVLVNYAPVFAALPLLMNIWMVGFLLCTVACLIGGCFGVYLLLRSGNYQKALLVSVFLAISISIFAMRFYAPVIIMSGPQ